MNSTDDEARGEEARRILDAPIYREAYRVIEERLVNELAQAEIAPERVEKVRNLLVGMRKVKTYLEQVLMTGTFSAIEEGKRNRAQQWLDRVRRYSNEVLK